MKHEKLAPKGVWVIFFYDVGAVPVAVFDNEIDALRVSNEDSYTHVKFWAFNQLWEHLHRGEPAAKRCKRCGTNETPTWVKCCPEHTTEQGPDSMCEKCALDLHPGGVTSV